MHLKIHKQQSYHMNFSFQKQKFSCYCISQTQNQSKYHGLISTQSAKKKYHLKQTINPRMKNKKVSLKTNKLPLKISLTPSTYSREYQDPMFKSDCTQNLNRTKQCPISMRESKKQSRQWLDRKKSQIHIQPITRVTPKHNHNRKDEILPQKIQRCLNQKFYTPISYKKNTIRIQSKNNYSQPVRIQHVNRNQKQQIYNKFEKQKIEKVKAKPLSVNMQSTLFPSYQNTNKSFTHKHSASDILKTPRSQRNDSQQIIFLKHKFYQKQKTILVPKQIQSVIDEDEEENMSQVLGHDWDGFDQEKEDQKLPTKTILTMATNERNSQLKNSLSTKILSKKI